MLLLLAHLIDFLLKYKCVIDVKLLDAVHNPAAVEVMINSFVTCFACCIYCCCIYVIVAIK